MPLLEMQHADLVRQLCKSGEDVLKGMSPFDANIVHAQIGISSEAGEIADIVKKIVIYRQEPDIEHAIEELGDLEFYLEQFRQALGIDREDTLQANISKLHIRYPNARYSDQAAKERADKLITGETARADSFPIAKGFPGAVSPEGHDIPKDFAAKDTPAPWVPKPHFRMDGSSGE